MFRRHIPAQLEHSVLDVFIVRGMRNPFTIGRHYAAGSQFVVAEFGSAPIDNEIEGAVFWIKSQIPTSAVVNIITATDSQSCFLTCGEKIPGILRPHTHDSANGAATMQHGRAALDDFNLLQQIRIRTERRNMVGKHIHRAPDAILFDDHPIFRLIAKTANLELRADLTTMIVARLEAWYLAEAFNDIFTALQVFVFQHADLPGICCGGTIHAVGSDRHRREAHFRTCGVRGRTGWFGGIIFLSECRYGKAYAQQRNAVCQTGFLHQIFSMHIRINQKSRPVDGMFWHLLQGVNHECPSAMLARCNVSPSSKTRRIKCVRR